MPHKVVKSMYCKRNKNLKIKNNHILSIISAVILSTSSANASSIEAKSQESSPKINYSSPVNYMSSDTHFTTVANNTSIQTETDQTNPTSYDNAVSGNPVFIKFDPGTGLLGRELKIPEDWGVRLGGISLADSNKIFTGGKKPGAFSANNLLILGVVVNTEKKLGWKGGDIGVNFLQFNGQNTNGYAGTLPGYDSTSPLAPFNRTELYEYWFAQDIITDKLKIRIGKTLPQLILIT